MSGLRTISLFSPRILNRSLPTLRRIAHWEPLDKYGTRIGVDRHGNRIPGTIPSGGILKETLSPEQRMANERDNWEAVIKENYPASAARRFLAGIKEKFEKGEFVFDLSLDETSKYLLALFEKPELAAEVAQIQLLIGGLSEKSSEIKRNIKNQEFDQARDKLAALYDNDKAPGEAKFLRDKLQEAESQEEPVKVEKVEEEQIPIEVEAPQAEAAIREVDEGADRRPTVTLDAEVAKGFAAEIDQKAAEAEEAIEEEAVEQEGIAQAVTQAAEEVRQTQEVEEALGTINGALKTENLFEVLEQAARITDQKIVALKRRYTDAAAKYGHALSSQQERSSLYNIVVSQLKELKADLQGIEDKIVEEKGIVPREQRMEENQELQELKKIHNLLTQTSGQQSQVFRAETEKKIKEIEDQIRAGYRKEFKDHLAESPSYSYLSSEYKNKREQLQSMKKVLDQAKQAVEQARKRVQAIRDEISLVAASSKQELESARDSLNEMIERLGKPSELLGEAAALEEKAEEVVEEAPQFEPEAIKATPDSGPNTAQEIFDSVELELQEKANQLGELADKGDKLAADLLQKLMQQSD